jgi:hypothetical protein
LLEPTSVDVTAEGTFYQARCHGMSALSGAGAGEVHSTGAFREISARGIHGQHEPSPGSPVRRAILEHQRPTMRFDDLP